VTSFSGCRPESREIASTFLVIDVIHFGMLSETTGNPSNGLVL
jgi:hypothetical protein